MRASSHATRLPFAGSVYLPVAMPKSHTSAVMETHCGSPEQWAAWCAADAAERAAWRPAAWKAAAAPPGVDGPGLYRMRTYTEQQWQALLAQEAASVSAAATHVNTGQVTVT